MTGSATPPVTYSHEGASPKAVTKSPRPPRGSEQPGSRSQAQAPPGSRGAEGRRAVDRTPHLLGEAPVGCPFPSLSRPWRTLTFLTLLAPSPGPSPSRSHLEGPSWLGAEGDKMALSPYLGSWALSWPQQAGQQE